ncbi:hypothetical protein ACHAXM_011984 [Skeletonema potamos]|jgi:hypothetical protein
MPTEEATSYGAIPRGDAEDNADFDETNLSYLKQSSFSWNRFCRATVPIIIALLIMGGFAFSSSSSKQVQLAVRMEGGSWQDLGFLLHLACCAHVFRE